MGKAQRAFCGARRVNLVYRPKGQTPEIPLKRVGKGSRKRHFVVSVIVSGMTHNTCHARTVLVDNSDWQVTSSPLEGNISRDSLEDMYSCVRESIVPALMC